MRIWWLGALWAGCNDVPDPDADARWEEAFEVGDETALSGVWGSGPDDVYMVGGDETRGAVYHFDGTDWVEDDTIATEDLLVWVFGFGADDVWIVGETGTVLRGSVGDWSPVDVGTAEPLWGVWGAAPDDLWIVGGSPLGDAPVLLHWDGASITPATLAPEQNDRKAVALFKVWGIDGRTFAVGQNGLIIELQGEEWVQMPAGADANDDFVSLWGTSGDRIVAVGGRSSARIATFDGTAWTTLASSTTPGLNAVALVSPEEVVIGGINGWVGRYDPDSGELTGENVVDGVSDVHAAWFDGADTTWGVSGRFTEPFRGT
ncbi:MAG: hypothetical protein AAF211_17665, partial [Myxococcota bacterium]